MHDFIVYLAKDRYEQFYRRGLPKDDASQIASSVIKWCNERNLNIFSVLAIIEQESYFNPKAKGIIGEKGLMQLSDTALDELERVYGIKVDRERIFDIDYNIELGTLYYLYCVRLANGKRFEAIARYHMTFHPEYEAAKKYAEEVMAKRDKIVSMYKKFIEK